MSSAESKIQFTGNVSFPNPEDSRQFVTLMSDFLDSSSRVFFEIEKKPMYHIDALGHAKALLASVENFELNAIYFEFKESQERCKKAYGELTQHVNNYEAVLLDKRPSPQKWSLAQAERLNLAIKGILGCCKNLVDFNENDVIVVVAQNIQLCHTAADNLEKATNFIPKHKQNLENVTEGLQDQIANRAKVIKDHAVQHALLDLNRRLNPAVALVMTRGTTDDFNNLRALLKEAQKLFTPQFSEGDFSYKDVDDGAFNSAIDDLLSSIQKGDGAGVRDNAGRLGNQAKALNDAGQALKEQTKRLLQASADALKNRESDDAQKRLAELMSQTKQQASDLAEQQARENKRRQQLLKASAGLGIAIDSMQGNLATYRDQLRHDMNPELERQMKEDEDDRLRKLNQ